MKELFHRNRKPEPDLGANLAPTPLSLLDILTAKAENLANQITVKEDEIRILTEEIVKVDQWIAWLKRFPQMGQMAQEIAKYTQR